LVLLREKVSRYIACVKNYITGGGVNGPNRRESQQTKLAASSKNISLGSDEICSGKIPWVSEVFTVLSGGQGRGTWRPGRCVSKWNESRGKVHKKGNREGSIVTPDVRLRSRENGQTAPIAEHPIILGACTRGGEEKNRGGEELRKRGNCLRKGTVPLAWH